MTPPSRRGSRNWMRWAIPLLIAFVAAVLVFLFARLAPGVAPPDPRSGDLARGAPPGSASPDPPSVAPGPLAKLPDLADLEADPDQPRPFRGVRRTLDNGFTVILVEDHSAPTIAAQVVVRVGAADDPEGIGGTAHFLEHMLFKGSTRLGTRNWLAEQPHIDRLRSLFDALPASAMSDDALTADIVAEATAAGRWAIPSELGRALNELGATVVNAVTTVEYTALFATLPANKLEPWAMLAADQFADPVMRGFVNERRVVREEIQVRSGHRETDTNARLRSALFGDHPYANPVAGTVDSLSAATPSTLEAFHERWYVPGNAAIVLVGDFVPSEAYDLLDATFGEIPAGDPPSRTIGFIPTLSGSRDLGPSGSHRTFLAWQIRDPEPMDYIALRAAGTHLRRLFVGVRPDEARGLKVELSRFRHAGYAVVSVECGEVLADRCMELLRSEIDRLRRGEGLDGAVARIRAQALVAELEAMEDHASHSGDIAGAWVRGATLADRWEELRQWDALTVDDVRSAIDRHLGDTYVVLSPGAVEAGRPDLSADRGAAVDVSDVAPSAFFEEVVSLPTPTLRAAWLHQGVDYTRTHDGVLAMPNPSNTLFQLTLRYPVGWWDHPGQCFAVDTWTPSSRSFSDRGGTVTTSCDRDETVITIKGRHLDLARGIAAVQAAFASPSVVSYRRWYGRRRARAGALESYALHAEESPFLTTFPRADELATDPEPRQALIVAMAGLRPEVSYTGALDAHQVRARLTLPEAADVDRPERTYVDLPDNRVVLRPTGRPTANVGIYRVGPAYDPVDEALYRLWEAYFGGQGGMAWELLRESVGGAYVVSADVQRGVLGEPTVLHIGFRCSTPEVFDNLERLVPALEGGAVDPSRWTAAIAAAEARAWSEHIPFRAAGAALHRWRRQGHAVDAREAAYQDLADLDESDFEAFMESLADRPLVITVGGGLERTGNAERLGELGELVVVGTADIIR